MRRRSAVVGIVVCPLAACVAVPPVQDPLHMQVEALVAPLVDAHQFSGAVVLMRDGRVLLARAWGLASREPELAFTPDTPSDGASLAKTFTAAGIWALVHEARLTMDQPVQALVPEYPHAGTTVGQLLAHSNGLAPDYGSFDAHFKPGQPRTTQGLLTLAGRATPVPSFAPGSQFEYSNLGYDAAAGVIERVSGQPYANFVRARFFEPHGLVHSFARPAHFADWPVPRTRAYRYRQGVWQLHDAYDDEAFLGASNLMFSASDLARWGDAWARGRVLPAQAERAGRESPRIGGRSSAIDGLSWYCDARGHRCHYTGSLNAFHSLVHWDRERRESVAFVSNSALPPWQTIALQRGLVAALADRPVAPMDTGVQGLKRIDLAARPSLAGRFAVDGLGTLELSVGGPALQLQLDDGLVYDAYPVSHEVLYVPGTDWWLAFSEGAPGSTGARPGGLRLHLRGMYHDAQALRLE